MRSVIRDPGLFERNQGTIPGLDGVRAIAAIWVVGLHCTFEANDLGGRILLAFDAVAWTAVDIFFVLSGYLIGSGLMRELATRGRIALRGFYVRRTMRIFPAYYVVLTLSLFVFARYAMFASLYAGPHSEMLAKSLYSYFYLTNYFPQYPSGMNWGWSLCVEEHFYLLLPPILIAIHRFPAWSRPWLLTLLALAPLGFRLQHFLRHPSSHFLAYYFPTHTRADGLLFGVVLAYLWVHHRDRVEKATGLLGPLLFPIACAGIAMMHPRFAPVLFLPVLFTVTAISAGAIVLNVLFVKNVVTHVLSARLWIPIARVSYALYLIHPFAIQLTMWLFGLRDTVSGSFPYLSFFLLTALLISLTAATVLHLLVERPLTNLGRRWASRVEPQSTFSAG